MYIWTSKITFLQNTIFFQVDEHPRNYSQLDSMLTQFDQSINQIPNTNYKISIHILLHNEMGLKRALTFSIAINKVKFWPSIKYCGAFDSADSFLFPLYIYISENRVHAHICHRLCRPSRLMKRNVFECFAILYVSDARLSYSWVVLVQHNWSTISHLGACQEATDRSIVGLSALAFGSNHQLQIARAHTHRIVT